MNILTDIIVYFARFPDRAGVLKNFSSQTDLIPGYLALKDRITALPAPLLPDIKSYVFSTNEMVLSNILKNTNGYFLLLEYGALESTAPGEAQTRDTSFNLAITVGHDSNPRNSDSMAESLIMEQCLGFLLQIREQMQQDNFDLCGNDAFLAGNISIAPVEPVLLYNHLGWTMSFKKNEIIE